MRQVLLASLRAHLGRLAATGTAVVLSVAFVVTTLLLTSAYTQTMADALTAQLARTDVQIVFDEDAAAGDIDARLRSVLDRVRALPAVAAADAQQAVYVQVRHGDRRAIASVEALLSEPLRWQQLAAGEWPTAPDEGTIDQANARTLGVAVGDRLTISGAGEQARAHEVRLVGITSTANAGFARGAPSVLVAPDTLGTLGAPIASTGILVKGAGGTSADALADQICHSIGADDALTVLTRAEAVDRQVAQLSGSSALFTTLLLAFGAIALLVASFVIANTFRVLVAQRSQELALLRCVGASRGQVYRLVLLEAGVVGVVFSALGALLGVGAAASVAALSRTGASGLALGPVSVSPVVLAGSILLGTAVTMLAALGPARNATRVPPVAALRPVGASVEGPVPMVPVVLGVLLAGIGATGLAYGATTGTIAIALVGGVVSAVAVLVLGSALLPPVIRAVGWGLARTSVPAQLAVANTDRNRTRTAATGTALVIGTILLAMLTTAITSIEDSVMRQIDDRRPFDLIVQTTDGRPIPATLVDTIRTTEAVVAVAPVQTATVTLVPAGGEGRDLIADGIDPSATRQVAHSAVAVPEQGTVRVNPADGPGLSEGDRVTVRGTTGELRLSVVLDGDLAAGQAQLAAADLAQVAGDPAAPGRLQLRLTPDLGAEEVQRVTTAILSLDDSLDVYGGAQERAYYQQMLDTMLMVVLALLAVAVVIAFVGIGNTAALSVIERRRESALLRALGLTRGQLVAMVCIESALTAAVAATVGLVVGVLFGWAGVMALGNSASRIEMAVHVPWGQLGLILLGATVAAIVAAAWPAYTASRRKPVHDLVAV